MHFRYLTTLAGKKFDVTYRTVETLEELLKHGPPTPYSDILLTCELEVARGRWAFTDLNLNKLLPQVKPMNIKEYLAKSWKAHNAA